MTFYLHIQESEDHVVESPNEAPVRDWSIRVVIGQKSEHVQSVVGTWPKTGVWCFNVGIT